MDPMSVSPLLPVYTSSRRRVRKYIVCDWMICMICIIMISILCVLVYMLCLKYTTRADIYIVYQPAYEALRPIFTPSETTQTVQTIQTVQPVHSPQTVTNPIAKKGSSHSIYQHHVDFHNVCYMDSKIYLLDNTEEEQKTQEQEYWNTLSPYWGIKHAYVKSSEFLQQKHVRLNGSTFMYTLAVDNIAQFYQEMVCHLPILLNSNYQFNTTGTSNVKFDQFFTPHMRIEHADNATYRYDWCDSQLKWVVETMEIKQNSVIDIRDQTWHEQKAGTKIVCFDKLTIYQAGSCNGLQGPYPANTTEVYASLRNHIFEKYNLKNSRTCIATVVIYDRSNASRRRLLNAQNITDYFREQISREGYKANVIQIADIPDSIFEQMKIYNGADLMIEPHSASNYNALFQSDHAIHFEVGQHGTWFGQGMAPYLPFNYTRFEYGWDLIPYDPKIDNQEFMGERSFYIQQQLIEDMWNQTKHRFCH